ncbi:MAG: ribonuclease H-like domain-containing protein [Alicyclobacillaceae bacterium]|nr:ribonuclease H-like domain-containing protein [Alicyclobacillaceae bacterium]
MPRSLRERIAALESSVRQGGATGGAVRGGEGGFPSPPGRLQQAPDAQLAGAAPAPWPQVLAVFGFERVDQGGGPVWCRTLRYDVLTRYGRHRFADLQRCELAELFRAAGLAGIRADWRKLRFFDTETTGLGSGAGTFPFLYALGQMAGDELVIDQYLLVDHADESALLHTLQRRLGGSLVVSFNGKAFDWPMLLSRCAMHRIADPPDVFHVDLLPPSRRLWRQRLASVALAELERAVLGMERSGDLPGREAPARYFAFLDERNPDLIRAVLEHNAADVCALVALAVRIADLLSGRREAQAASEHLALARWYDEWGQHDLAARAFAAAAAAPDATWSANWLRGLHHKRRGQWAEAVQVWREMADRHPWTVAPLVELAKWAEHHERRHDEAEAYAMEALRRAQLALGRVAGAADVVAELRRRVERVRRKRLRQAPPN